MIVTDDVVMERGELKQMLQQYLFCNFATTSVLSPKGYLKQAVLLIIVSDDINTFQMKKIATG